MYINLKKPTDQTLISLSTKPKCGRPPFACGFDKSFAADNQTAFERLTLTINTIRRDICSISVVEVGLYVFKQMIPNMTSSMPIAKFI